MRSVIPPLIILTWDAALFLYSSRRRWSRRQAIFWMGASFILAFGAGGFSETYAALQVVIFSLALALVILVGRRRAADSSVRFAAAGLAGAILSVLVIIISPGNAARAASFPPRPGPLGVMGISAQSYASFFSQIASSPLNILALAAATGFGLWIGLHTSIGPRGWRTAAFVLMAGLILTFSCFPPAAYGQSSAPPNRTLVIPTYLLVLTAVFLGIAVSPRLAARWKFLAPFSYVSILLLWLAAVLSLSQMFAVRPTYIAYAHAWARFNSQMISFRQAGVATAVISTADQKANNWAGLNTLGDTTRFWLNKCVGDYYGVKVISTTP